MPRTKKSTESLEAMPVPEVITQSVEMPSEIAEKPVEKKKRAPRKKKVEEPAIDDLKAEIIEKIEASEHPEPVLPEKHIWEKESGINDEGKEFVAPTLATEERAEPAIAEHHAWTTKWAEKNQQPKAEQKEQDSLLARAWRKIRKPFMIGAFTAGGLLASMKANATHEGPSDSLTKKESVLVLTEKEKSDWNNFIDFLATEGLRGSVKLEENHGKLGKEMIEKYRSLNPGTTVNLESIARIQKAMEGTRDAAQALAKRKNEAGAENLMTGISKVDNILGHKTSDFKFPNITRQGVKIGLADATFPADAKGPHGEPTEVLNNGGRYYQNADGDWVMVINKK